MSSASWLVGAAAVLISAATWGCSAPDGGEVVDTSSESVNGTVRWGPTGSSCLGTIPGTTTTYRELLGGAVARASDHILRPAMASCLENAVLAMSPLFPEYIVSQLTNPVPTEINCANLTFRGDQRGAEAGPAQSEIVTFDWGFLNTLPSVPGLSDLFMHELAHTRGYGHPNAENTAPGLHFRSTIEHRHSVSDQLMKCSADIAAGVGLLNPNGGRRDQSGRESTLAPAGGPGGAANMIRCAGSVATGLNVRAGSRIDAVGLKCFGLLGPNPDTTIVGGSGGSLSPLSCTANELLVGISGRADNFTLTGITPLCMDASLVTSGRRREADLRFPGSRGSQTAGVQFRRWCPPFQAVTGMRIMAGQLVDRIEVDCADLSSVSKTVTELQRFGGNGGRLYVEKCAGRQAMVGLSLQSGWQIDRLGGICAPVTTNCGGGSCTSFISPGVTQQFMVSHGGNGGQVGEMTCPSGSALVGLNIKSGGAALDGVHGICADVQAWAGTGPAPTQSFFPIFGGITGGSAPTVPVTCPRGSFLDGWWIRAGALVDGITPLCRTF